MKEVEYQEAKISFSVVAEGPDKEEIENRLQRMFIYAFQNSFEVDKDLKMVNNECSVDRTKGWYKFIGRRY